MNLLFLGDVVGSAGCEAVQRFLPQLKRQYAADLTIVNGENSADGNGIHRPSAQALLDAGADLITTGNHVLRRAEIYDWLDQTALSFALPICTPPRRGGAWRCWIFCGTRWRSSI